MAEGSVSETSRSPPAAQGAMLSLLSPQWMALGRAAWWCWPSLGPRVVRAGSKVPQSSGPVGECSGEPALQWGAQGTRGARR